MRLSTGMLIPFFTKAELVFCCHALMITIIHQYNSRNHSSLKSIIKPVCVGDDTTAIATEPMGIVLSDAIGQDQSWQQDHTDIIDTTSILNIQASLSQLYIILKAMKSQTKTASPLWKYMPFIQNLLQSQIQHNMPCHAS